MKITEKDLLNKIREIPPLPNIAVEVMKLAEDPTASIKDIVDVVKFDQGITAKLLKICNSTYFGLERKINSLNEAMIYIGQNTLINLIYTTCSSGMFKKEFDGYFLEKGELWRHSVACAICSQLVSKKLKAKNADMAFTAGLLHDLGKIILNGFLKDKSEEITKLVEKDEFSFLQAEKEIVGLNHCEAGAIIAETWKFPDSLIEVLRYHHEPENAVLNKPLTYIVHIGNIICISEGIGVGLYGMAVEVSPVIREFWNLSEIDFDDIALNLKEDIVKADDLLSD